MPIDKQILKATMLKASKAAARESLNYFRSSLKIDNKYEIGFDPVTIADQKAEIAIRDIISAAFPDHSIEGEEFEDKKTNSPYTWVIDPIDGTRSYISGLPVWGTLIGLKENGKAIAGLMSQPYIGEIFIAVDGDAEFIHLEKTTKLQARKTTKLKDAIIFTTDPKLFSNKKNFEAFQKLEKQVLLSRYGTDCYAFSLLAAGQIDLVIEPDLKPYDIAPLIALIENAGGVVSTWSGERAENGGNIIASATPELLYEALEILHRHLV